MKASLTERCDAASTALAFELAAKLQHEIEALDWVTAEQKVARSSSEDHTVCGWSEGCLVRFEIQAGRLTNWTQRRCSEATAGGEPRQTPPGWTVFAVRNAELAARLAV